MPDPLPSPDPAGRIAQLEQRAKKWLRELEDTEGVEFTADIHQDYALVRDLLEALVEVETERARLQQWQPIATAPKDGTLIIGALIRDGKVWRIHDMKHNGLAFYTVNGGSLPQMTHWLPIPPPIPEATR